MLRSLLVALALAAVLVAPSAAPAAEVRLEYLDTRPTDRHETSDVYRLVVEAAPGERNRIDVSGTDRRALITDRGAPLRAGASCRAEGEAVVCEPAVRRGSEAGVARALDVDVRAGDEDDEVHAVLAGTGFPYAGILVRGGPGADRLRAGSGVLDGGPGPDDLDGDPGQAVGITYADRTAPVSVRVDDAADDGEAGEGDRVGSHIGALTGGAGDDVLRGAAWVTGGAGNDVLAGTDGEDRLVGGDGDDTLEGADGPDDLRGGRGDDRLRGGDGVDQVNYGIDGEYADRPVVASIGDGPGDGFPGERDDIGADVERLVGSVGDDRLTGDGGAQELDGSNGDDELAGGGGSDRLVGGFGRDRLDPGAGQDVLVNIGHDEAVRTRDGDRDEVICDSGGRYGFLARVDADPDDRLRGCVVRPGTRFGDPLTVSRRGVASIRLLCPRASALPCAGRLSMRHARRDLATARFRIRPGRTAVVSLRPARRDRRRILTRRVRVVDLLFDLRRPARPSSRAVIYAGDDVRLRVARR